MNTIAKEITDPIVSSVVNQFIARSEAGQKKYGTNLSRNDLTPEQWIQHMKEELMDAILYLEKISEIRSSRMYDDEYVELNKLAAQYSVLHELWEPGSKHHTHLKISIIMDEILRKIKIIRDAK